MNEQDTISRRFKPMGPVSKWLAPLLALIATSAASYLAYLSVDDSAVIAGCEAESGGCADVLITQWAAWFGIPVGFGAIIVYATILLTLLASSKQISKIAWLILIACTTLAVGSGIWFSGLLYFDLGAFCPWCMTTHSCGLLLTIWLWLRIPLAAGEVEYQGRPTVTVAPKHAKMMVLTGLLGLAVLVGGQMYNYESEESLEEMNTTAIVVDKNIQGTSVSHQDETTAHDHSAHAHADDDAHDNPDTTPAENPSDASDSAKDPSGYQPFKPKKIFFLDGQLSLMLTGHPVIGSPDAEHYVAVMFDYTCAACRKMHLNLREAMEFYDNQFAMIFMPMPLDSLCNPKVKATSYGHRGSCTYAKLSLAVWIAKPEAFDEFDHRILEKKKRPSTKAARMIAEQLVGKKNLEKALKNPAINEILRNDFALFYSKALYKKSVPVLITENKLRFGNPATTEELHQFLEENLGLHKPDESTEY